LAATQPRLAAPWDFLYEISRRPWRGGAGLTLTLGRRYPNKNLLTEREKGKIDPAADFLQFSE
jgi:hypothetical protein